jgi:spermidine/putrescine-binding protein
MNRLATGDFCISMSWSADYATSRARAGPPASTCLASIHPEAHFAFDALLIPADAPHPRAAPVLNYILEPQVIAAITNADHANDNAASIRTLPRRS